MKRVWLTIPPLLVAGAVWGQTTGWWTNDPDSIWSTAANWTNGVPSVVGDAAIFGDVLTANRNVTVDGPTAVSRLVFDGKYSYTLIIGGGSLTLTSAVGNAAIVVTGVGGATLNAVTLGSSLDITNLSTATLNLNGALTGNGLTITKAGLGRLNVNADNSATLSNTTWVLNRGITQIANEKNLGALDNDVTFGGGVLAITGAITNNAAKVLTFTGGSFGGLDIGATTYLLNAGNLAGSGALLKSGSSTLVVSNANTGFDGAVTVINGLLDASGHASALGTNGAAGLLSAAGGGQLNLAGASYSDRRFAVGAAGVVRGDATAFGSLVRGTNFTATAGAVIAQTNAGANASVGNLGQRADLFFGIEGDVTDTGLTALGAGTPWKGLSSTRASSIYRGNSILVNSDITLQALGVTLTLGTNGAVNALNLTGAVPYVVTITAPTGTGNIRLAGDNPDMSGVSKFVVTMGAALDPKGINSFGGRTVEVMQAGMLGTPSQGGSRLNNSPTNNYGSSVVQLAGANRVYLYGPYSTPMGGNFELRGTLPVLFQTNQGEPTGTGTQIHSISNVTIFAAGAAIQHAGGSFKALDITNSLAGGTYAFSVNPQNTGTTRLYTSGTITGGGTLTKGDGGQWTITGNLGGFSGSVIVKGGQVDLPTVGPAIFSGPVTIGSYLDFQGRDIGYAVLVLNQNSNGNFTAASTGILALGVDNDQLTATPGAGFLGASGTKAFKGTSLAAGAGSTYRLGGGFGTPVLVISNSVLTGANNLIIGGGVLKTKDHSTNLNGAGTVTLVASNDFTGTTLVSPASTLNAYATNVLGGSTTTSAGDITVFGTLNLGHTTGGAGSVHPSFTNTIWVQRGGVFNLVNTGGGTSLSRIPDTTPITITGGTLTMNGNTGASVVETAGVFTVVESVNLGLTRGGATRATTLTVTNLLRSGRATLQLNPATAADFGIRERLVVLATNSVSLFSPWVVNAGGSGNFVQLDAAGSFTTATYSAATVDTATSADIVNVTAAQTMANPGDNVRALRLGAGLTRVAAGSTTLNIGGLLDTEAGIIGAANATLGSTNTGADVTLAFGAREAIVYVHSGTTLTVATNTTLTGSLGLTKFGAGTLDLRATNSYSGLTGGLTINAGTVRINNSVAGNDILLQGDATLQLRTDVTNLVFSSGTMLVRSTPTGSSTFSIDRDSTVPTSAQLRLANLVVADNSRLNLTSTNSYSLVITNSLTLSAGAIIRYDYNGTVLTFVGNAALPNYGYSDTPTSAYYQNHIDSFGRGLNFETLGPVTVNAEVRGQRAGLTAAGAGTEVTYQGSMGADCTTTSLTANRGARILIGASATIDVADGWNGQLYGRSSQLAIGGDGTGEIEFLPGFVATKVYGTGDRTDVDVTELRVVNGGRFSTDHSLNLSTGQGYIYFEGQNARWTVQSNDQVAATTVRVNNGIAVEFREQNNLTLTAPLLLGADSGDLSGTHRDWTLAGVVTRYPGYSTPGVAKIIKTGSAALNVNGPLLVSYDSTFEVQQGTLNVNGNVIPTTADSTLNITNNGGSTTFNASLSLWAGNRLRVNVDGATPTLTVGTGRVLSGSGTLVNGASIGLGGTLRPGENIGILTVGDLTLSSGSILLYELGAPEQLAPGQVATGANDLTAVIGSLKLDGGTLYVTDVGGFTNGVYTIFTYTGALVTSNLTVAPLPGGLSGVVDYGVTGEVNLQVIPEPSAGLLVGAGLLVLLAVRRRGTR